MGKPLSLKNKSHFHITSNRAICGGKPIIKGTRISVELIVDLLKNPEKLKEIGQAGAREVDRIGWDKAGTSVKEVYRECAC